MYPKSFRKSSVFLYKQTALNKERLLSNKNRYYLDFLANFFAGLFLEAEAVLQADVFFKEDNNPFVDKDVFFVL